MNGPAAGQDREYAHLARPLPSLYLTDADDRWRSVYHLADDDPVVEGRWQYRVVPENG